MCVAPTFFLPIGSWFSSLSATAPHREVNFWTPKRWGGRFGILSPGDLLLFRLKAPLNVIGGGGVFAHYSELPIGAAWDAFGTENGADSASALRASIGRLREEPATADVDYSIGCIVLTDPFFWPEDRWLPLPDGYPPNAVRGKGYQLTEGSSLWEGLLERYVQRGTITGARERTRRVPGGYGDPIPRKPRLGQGAFRVMVADAYGRRCAVTREGALPALEAAHIQPFPMTEVHEVQNGLLLRSDIHRLFDAGYVTITDDYVFQASSRLKTDFDGGESYLAMQGSRIAVPLDPSLRPDPELLRWHNIAKFKFD